MPGGGTQRQARAGSPTAVTLAGDWRKNGLQMLTIGLGAAIVGYLISRLFGAAGA